MDYYILQGKSVIKTTDILDWGRWFEKADRTIGKTQLPNCLVSTVFLGLDHSFGNGPPLLFETMVFPLNSYSEMDVSRSSTYDEAERDHLKMVAKWTALNVRQPTTYVVTTSTAPYPTTTYVSTNYYEPPAEEYTVPNKVPAKETKEVAPTPIGFRELDFEEEK